MIPTRETYEKVGGKFWRGREGEGCLVWNTVQGLQGINTASEEKVWRSVFSLFGSGLEKLLRIFERERERERVCVYVTAVGGVWQAAKEGKEGKEGAFSGVV